MNKYLYTDSWSHKCDGILVECGWASNNSEGKYVLSTTFKLTQENNPTDFQALLDLGWKLIDGKWNKENNYDD